MYSKVHSSRDFKNNDPIGRKSIKENIHIPSCKIVDNTNNDIYSIDLKIISGWGVIYGYIECEMKNEKKWINNFPFETVSFLERKIKYYKEGIRSYYILINKNCSTAVMKPFKEILDYPIDHTDCKYANSEPKIYVPKQYCTFGWKNIETYIINDIFPLKYPQNTSLLDILSRSTH